MSAIRVLIADDHPVFRFGLRALIQTETGMEVVGEAASGNQAVEMVEKLAPDVVLMDLNMPEGDGIQATRQICARYPDVHVLVVTMIEDDTVVQAIQAGALGYILKGEEGEDTLRAIQAAAKGEALFSPEVARRLQRYLSSAHEPVHVLPELTDREREILTLIEQGLTNTAIAERLYLSPKTVRNQVSIILNKLQVSDRMAASKIARDARLGRSNPKNPF